MRKILTLFLVIYFLAGASISVWGGGLNNTDPRYPQRQYRRFLLPNQMKVMLISDPTLQRGAASLTVAVGSMSDPSGRSGLAHFLEHMLFLGTETLAYHLVALNLMLRTLPTTAARSSGKGEGVKSLPGHCAIPWSSSGLRTWRAMISISPTPVACIRPRYGPSSIAPPRQPAQVSWNLVLRSGSNWHEVTMSEMAIRPPGLSTRNASR